MRSIASADRFKRCHAEPVKKKGPSPLVREPGPEGLKADVA